MSGKEEGDAETPGDPEGALERNAEASTPCLH